MTKTKTTHAIYDQWQRCFAAFMRRGTRLARRAHPETGGNEMLVHNWGNESARHHWRETWARETAARAIYDRLYAAAEHRTHGVGFGCHFRPMWCELCNAERKAS